MPGSRTPLYDANDTASLRFRNLMKQPPKNRRQERIIEEAIRNQDDNAAPWCLPRAVLQCAIIRERPRRRRAEGVAPCAIGGHARFSVGRGKWVNQGSLDFGPQSDGV